MFQVVFCLDHPLDPALPVAEKVKAERPDLDISVVVSCKRIGCNPKINNLANGCPKVKHGILLVSDSDVRVRPDFLARSVAPFRDPSVGLVSCFYRTPAERGFTALLESLAINAHFLPQALTAAAFGMRFTMGAAVLVRRDVFESIGAFGRLADHIADDYTMGEAIHAAGYRSAFSGAVVETFPGSGGIAEHLRHQIRESRVIRLCQPAGYCGLLALHSMSLLTLAALWAGPTAMGAAAFVAVWASRAVATSVIQRILGGRAGLRALALLPLSDWVAFSSWLLGFGSNRVFWRGTAYSIHPSGRLTPVSSTLEVPAA